MPLEYVLACSNIRVVRGTATDEAGILRPDPSVEFLRSATQFVP